MCFKGYALELSAPIRFKISMISEISVVQKHENFDGNIGILSISIKIE